MNRLVIIGNGFDMAHGLKTSYMDFISWYWEQRLNTLLTENTTFSKDCLCELEIENTEKYGSWHSFFFLNSYRNPINGEWKFPPLEILQEIMENKNISVVYSHFFKTILQSIETKGWVDIENDYYQLLKECMNNPTCGYTAKKLNKELAFVQGKLVEYLGTIEAATVKYGLRSAIIDIFNPVDFSTEGRRKANESIGYTLQTADEGYNEQEKWRRLQPQQIMLLSFNYTDTALKYGNRNIVHNYIHGSLEQPEKIIFGYGDELDKDYQNILDKNDNELLQNVKSVKYLETSHYRKMLEFIQSAPFQVYIMGHSCGNSDRTLLNTVFEHDNCVSIKPFYYRRSDGSDNYLELVQNISRSFTSMKLFRDRVVNKEQCEAM